MTTILWITQKLASDRADRACRHSSRNCAKPWNPWEIRICSSIFPFDLARIKLSAFSQTISGLSAPLNEMSEVRMRALIVIEQTNRYLQNIY